MSGATAAPSDYATPTPADGDQLFEVVNGKTVEKPPMGVYPTWIAVILTRHLGNFADAHELGRAVCEMLFDLNPPDQPQRRPDVAFVSYEHWPKRRKVPSTNAWGVVPDLAVEVVSPTNTAESVLSKVLEYFEAGVRLVWVIYPNQHLVQVYESPTLIRVLRHGDQLDGGPILPGFQLSLATLFEDDAVAD